MPFVINILKFSFTCFRTQNLERTSMSILSLLSWPTYTCVAGTTGMETLVPLSVVGIWKYLAAAWIRRDIERQFQYFGTVSCINLYPVKGCHATRVKSAQCGVRGLEVNGVKDRYDLITLNKSLQGADQSYSIQWEMII